MASTSAAHLPLKPARPSRIDQAATAGKRAIGLGADAIVLTLAAPFFAGWFAFKTIRRWIDPR